MNLDERHPCSDGNCTGTVENGVCRVCGASESGSPPQPAVASEPDPPEIAEDVSQEISDVPSDLEDVSQEISDVPSDLEDVSQEISDVPSDLEDERRPCPDGNCTGTVEGGVCRVCGAAA